MGGFYRNWIYRQEILMENTFNYLASHSYNEQPTWGTRDIKRRRGTGISGTLQCSRLSLSQYYSMVFFLFPLFYYDFARTVVGSCFVILLQNGTHGASQGAIVRKLKIKIHTVKLRRVCTSLQIYIQFRIDRLPISLKIIRFFFDMISSFISTFAYKSNDTLTF